MLCIVLAFRSLRRMFGRRGLWVSCCGDDTATADYSRKHLWVAQLTPFLRAAMGSV